jgi:hypothetical protein
VPGRTRFTEPCVEHRATVPRIAVRPASSPACLLVVIGGPIGDVDGEFVVLVVRAEDETAARALFDTDPWMGSILRIDTVERCTLWIGADRL